MQPQKELITETALLEMANKIIREHEDFIHGMRADTVEQKGDILVFKGEFFLAEDGTPTGKTMAVFNMFKLLAQQLSGKYRLG
ncbi:MULTISPECIES: YciN family protein [Aeromonas]|uniref:YciN family protein n=1 Tax=Aeromonas TaxID=642 RepID=UPI0005C24A5C|nr:MULTISPECIES: YciN family protein [Aeromonas]MBP4042926.1 YciN family protein [Aeromonas sp. SrichE-2G]MCO4205924.1 YciN family protein [Aeromonas taiwanensis]QXB54938.1 YciN family protein [Aeromonas sp. FDAARGOS 1415]